MDETTDFRDSAHWRLAVWGLRVIGPGLVVVAIGLVGLLLSTGTGQVILTVGLGIYLVGVVITVLGIVLVYREVPPPRPNFIDLRWALLHDAVHARSASTGPEAEGSGSVDGRPARSSPEDARRSARWRPAVWGVRAMASGLAVVVAGLVTLAWSTSAGKVILAVGIGVYVVAALFMFLEIRRAYSELPPPRPQPSRVMQTLLHDAVHARS